MQEYLPWKNFEWMSPHQFNYDFIKGLEPEGEVGCIIQCSLEYPVDPSSRKEINTLRHVVFCN